jgi:hypothetical protein
MQKSPLQQVKDRFTDKDGLVSAVKELAKGDLWADRLNEDKGLELVSNKKLLHLHEVLSAVKSEFGSREKLIAAILERENRGKDEGYKARFESWSTPRLLDHYRNDKGTHRPKKR